MQEFDLLNEIAQWYSAMSDMEQITFKAVLEHERPESLADAVEIMEHLPEYQLDYKSLHHVVFCDKINFSGLISKLLRNLGCGESMHCNNDKISLEIFL